MKIKILIIAFITSFILAGCESTEDNTGSDYGNGFRSVHDSFHGRKMALGLPVGVSLHGRRRLFREQGETLILCAHPFVGGGRFSKMQQ